MKNVNVIKDDELRLFRDLVKEIQSSHYKEWEKLPYTDDAAQIQNEVTRKYQMITSEELEAFLPLDENVSVEFPKHKFIFLKPILHGFRQVPLLHLKCDFGKIRPETNLRLGLFSLHNGSLKATGFRLESPSEARTASNDETQGEDTENDKSKHNFYHLQMISGFQKHKRFLVDDNISFVPEKEPTFPLDANAPVKLLLCLLVGCYGLRETSSWLGSSNVDKKLVDFLADMYCHNTPSMTWYWKVETASGKVSYYMTDKSPEQFKAFCQEKHQRPPKGITKGFYDGLSSNKKKVY